MQWELLTEAATRQDHSSLQTSVFGGSPGTVNIPFHPDSRKKKVPCMSQSVSKDHAWLTCGVVERFLQINSETLVASLCFSSVPQTVPAFPSEDIMCLALHQWLQPTLPMIWGYMANLQPVV